MGSFGRRSRTQITRGLSGQVKKYVCMHDSIPKTDKYWYLRDVSSFIMTSYLSLWISLFVLPQINDGQKRDSNKLLLEL